MKCVTGRVSWRPVFVLGRVNGTLDDVEVVNLSTFVTRNASFEILGFQLFVAVDLENVTLTGRYDVDGSLEGGSIHFFGEGAF